MYFRKQILEDLPQGTFKIFIHGYRSVEPVPASERLSNEAHLAHAAVTLPCPTNYKHWCTKVGKMGKEILLFVFLLLDADCSAIPAVPQGHHKGTKTTRDNCPCRTLGCADQDL